MYYCINMLRRPTLYMIVSCAFTCLFIHDIYINRKIESHASLPQLAWPVALTKAPPGDSTNTQTTTLLSDPDDEFPQIYPEDDLYLDFREPRNDGPNVDDNNMFYVKVRSIAVDNTILIVFITEQEIELADNFYFSSIVKHNITNYLFVALDEVACDNITSSFSELVINCFVYATDPYIEEASLSTFKAKKKAHFRSKVTHQLITYGFSVAYSEVNSVFFRNVVTLSEAKCERKGCDVMVSAVGSTYNLGYSYTRPTKAAVRLYSGILQLADDMPSIEQAFSWALKDMVKQTHPIVVGMLSNNMFVSSTYYFRNETCVPDEIYNNTAAILGEADHNEALSLFRMKDCLLSEFDNAGYYTSINRRYIMFDAAVDLSKMHKALLNIFLLASASKRIVILPRFFKPELGRRRILPSWALGISYLDFKQLNMAVEQRQYRESNFLLHHLVPGEVKSSVSSTYQIMLIENAGVKRTKDVTPIIVNASASSVYDIARVLNKSKHSVVVLKSLFRYIEESIYVRFLGQELHDLINRLRYP